jgi:hypothetical protein
VPAAPLTSSLQDPRVLAFLLVLFGVNLLCGLGSISMAGVEQAIAWQAHIGGFLAGLLAFAAFDPIPISTGGGPNEGMDAPPPQRSILIRSPAALCSQCHGAQGAALRVRCECGARGDTCAWRLSSCADCVNLSVFVSCCGALRGARCRRATQSFGNRIPPDSCLCYVNAVPSRRDAK